MEAKEIIENACNQIVDAMKEGRFTKDDLEFLIKFFQLMQGTLNISLTARQTMEG